MKNNDYHTLRGYNLLENAAISSAMEDYLEMIYRLYKQGGHVRVNHLAALLNVTPPSASKMAAKLKEQGLVAFEPYGEILPTARGMEHGAYLLRRHDALHRLLCKINATDNELVLAEKIEHFFDADTVANIEKFLNNLGTSDIS